MKKIYIVPFILLAAACMFLSSCTSKKDPSPSITAAVGQIDLKVGSTSLVMQGGAELTSNQIILGGAATTGEVLSIITANSAATGVYDIKGLGAAAAPIAEVNYFDAQGDFYSSLFSAATTSIGSIDIVEIDQTNHTISGTFTCNVVLDDGSANLAITAGSFNKIPFVTVAASSLTAKIDGVAFTAGLTIGATADNYIVVNGQSLGGDQIITVSVPSNVTPGSYTMGDLTTAVYGTYTTSSDTFTSNTGTLTVTKNDASLKRLEGTFTFTTESFADETAGPSITSGTFAVTYQ